MLTMMYYSNHDEIGYTPQINKNMWLSRVNQGPQ